MSYERKEECYKFVDYEDLLYHYHYWEFYYVVLYAKLIRK